MPFVEKSVVIVVGNEKGGSGKSTLSMHLAVSYMYAGHSVATIDLDGRQGTLTHYIENRERYARAHSLDIPMPEHLVVTPSQYASIRSTREDEEQLDAEIAGLKKEYGIVIIDTPGTYNHLSNAGHKNADILLTPVNDSMVDIDVVASIDPLTGYVSAENQYTRNIREIEVQRRKLGKKPLRWLLLRNRISHIGSQNKREVDEALKVMSSALGFDYVQGIGERVVYREMFLKGLTVLDMLRHSVEDVSISHIAAKNELEAILDEIGIPYKPAGLPL